MKIDPNILCALLRSELRLDAVTEYRFAAEMVGIGKGLRQRLSDAGLKDWRFDVAIIDHKIAIELEGGVFTRGRHSRGMGMVGDINKYNAATVNGWSLVRFTHTHHTYTDVLKTVKAIMSRG